MTNNHIHVILVCSAVAVTVGIIAASIDGIHSTTDGEFILCTALLGGILSLPLAMSVQKWTIRLDHPSVLMACVLTMYWLFGAFVAHSQRGSLCINAQDFVGRSAFAGVIAAAFFYLGAGLPNQDRPQQEPEMSQRVSECSTGRQIRA